MSESTTSTDSSLSRREVLTMSGAVGVTALAGCSTETPGGDASVPDGNMNSVGSDKALTVPGRYVPTNLQWNSYAPSHYAQQGGKMVFDPFLQIGRAHV